MIVSCYCNVLVQAAAVACGLKATAFADLAMLGEVWTAESIDAGYAGVYSAYWVTETGVPIPPPKSNPNGRTGWAKIVGSTNAAVAAFMFASYSLAGQGIISRSMTRWVHQYICSLLQPQSRRPPRRNRVPPRRSSRSGISSTCLCTHASFTATSYSRSRG